MRQAEACLRLAADLPESLVAMLIAQLRSGVAPMMSSPVYQARVSDFLHAQVTDGTSRECVAAMLEVALAAQRARPTTELVWTGPPTPIVPARKTEQVLFDLIEEATSRLTITSFGVFQIPRLVHAMERAIQRNVNLRIVLGDRESKSDMEVDRQKQQLGPVVASKATLLQWPADRRMRDEQGRSGLMHVKVVVSDSRKAFLTSANLTEAALERNMELGLLLSGGEIPESVERLVDALWAAGDLVVT